MASYVIPQCGIVRLIWQLSSVDTAVNVLGFYNPSSLAITQTLTNTIGSAIKASFTSSGLAAIIGTQVALSKIGLRDINQANLPEFIDAGSNVNGTSAGDLLPANVTYCVTIRTAKAGKSFRGRYYQYGYTETNNLATGQPSSVGATTAAFVNAIGSALSANGLQPAVLSRRLNDHTVWSSATNRTAIWSTQRRRLIPGI